jgi:hypothetical protein
MESGRFLIFEVPTAEDLVSFEKFMRGMSDEEAIALFDAEKPSSI